MGPGRWVWTTQDPPSLVGVASPTGGPGIGGSG
jgi:hypothetical protein